MMMCGAEYGLVSGFESMYWSSTWPHISLISYASFTSKVTRGLGCIISLTLRSFGMTVFDAPLHRDDGILMVRRNVGSQYSNGLSNPLE